MMTISGDCEHIMKLEHYYDCLKAMLVDFKNSYLIHHALKYFLAQFDVLKISYHIQNGERTMNEKIFIVSQVEDDMKKEKVHSFYIVSHGSRAKHVNKSNQKYNKEKFSLKRRKLRLKCNTMTLVVVAQPYHGQIVKQNSHIEVGEKLSRKFSGLLN